MENADEELFNDYSLKINIDENCLKGKERYINYCDQKISNAQTEAYTFHLINDDIGINPEIFFDHQQQQDGDHFNFD